MRRGRENQCVSERFERATPIWTRSSYFHTGPRRVNCRTMRPDTRKRLTTCRNPKKNTCIQRGVHTRNTPPNQIVDFVLAEFLGDVAFFPGGRFYRHGGRRNGTGTDGRGSLAPRVRNLRPEMGAA